MLISFAFGDDYYHQAARQLRADCEATGTPCHIVQAELPAGTSWIDACRYKVRFIEECRARFEAPLWWVDVDSRLLRPLPLIGAGVDLAFFLRGFRDFREFDPVALPRVIQPSIVYFGATAAAGRFVRAMADSERTFEGSATDDWFMQEAWVATTPAPTVAVLSPALVRVDDGVAPEAVFQFGRSGQAAVFKGSAAQHDIELFSAARRKAVLLREATRAGQEGHAAESRLLARLAQRADPADEELAFRVAREWLDEGQPAQAEKVLSNLPPTGRAANHLARFRLDRALDHGDAAAAQRQAAILLAGDSEADRRWAQGRELRIGLARRARNWRVRLARRPELWWMEGPFPGNFGDILNPYVVEKITGLPPVYGRKGEGVLAIGSTIRFAKDGAVVWGAGTPRMSDRLNPRARYAAVRGPLTARLVEASGAPLPKVLGDPACLLPRLYRPNASTRRYRLGVVLHHAHAGQLRFEDDVKVIEVLRAGYAGIEALVDEICQCERVLSSSLHGLIVSHAYGIPAQWIDVAGGTGSIPGDGTKFHDYLLSVGLEAGEPLRIQAGSLVGLRQATSESLPRQAIDLDALLDVAPWRLRSGI